MQTEFLVLRSASRICAVPLAHVVETMRPLPLRAFRGAPGFVRGMSVIRGAPTAVVDLDVLLGHPQENDRRRWVSLRVGERRLALAVGDVLGIRAFAESGLGALPPLLANSDTRVVQSIGSLDSDLLVVLQAGRLLPDEVWQALEAEEAGSCPQR